MTAYLVLARKYRPTTFSEVVGQDHAVQALTNSIVSGRVAHAFLLCGVRGVGKTTVARILAKSLNCTNRPADDANPCNRCTSCREITDGVSVDVQEIDGASHTSVDNIREINENIKYPPSSSTYKVIIIDEVHMISVNAFNALLKTLEEPPPHAKFIFATTESHKVPATINSRCQKFNFRTVSVKDMVEAITKILISEKVEASQEALSLVATQARGSFRDALSILDQVIAYGSGRVTVDDVVGVLGLAGRDTVGKLVEAVVLRDAARALTLAQSLFREGLDPERIALELINYLRTLLVLGTVPPADRLEGMADVAPSELEEMNRLLENVSPRQAHYLLEILLKGEDQIRRSQTPSTALEIVLFRMVHAPELVDLSEVLRKLGKPGALPQLPSGHGASRPRAIEAPPSPERAVPAPEISPLPSRPPVPAAVTTEPPAEAAPAPNSPPRPTPRAEGRRPDEVWIEIKKRLQRDGIDPIAAGYMDHGSLISYNDQEVEIGFHKSFYKSQFEETLRDKKHVEGLFREYFGQARFKVLVLAAPTSLAVEKPYRGSPDGQSDKHRALRQEAMDHPIVRAVQREFEDSTIQEIKIL